jgi:MerR family transcriptional regulator, copper efflux regulator
MHTQLPTERQKRDSRPTEQLTIGQLARLTGISAKAIRYYESIGLLPAPERANNGYRCYTQVDVNRLILLQRLQLLGVPLAALKSLLAGTSDARCSEVQHEVLALVHARLMALDQEIKELHLLREQVESYQSRLASCPTDEHQPFRACLDLSCLALGSEIR